MFIRDELAIRNADPNLLHLWGDIIGIKSFYSHSVVFFLKSSNQKFTEKAIRDKKEYAEIVNGSQVLPDTLFEKCQKFRKFSYQLGARVTSLSEKGKRITVGFTVGRKRDISIQGHYAIVTATAREVSLMKFQPPLPYMKLNAVRSLEYLGSVKVFLKFKTAFWAEENKIPRIRYNDPEKKNGATAVSDDLLRNTYYPSHSYHGPTVLASYSWELQSELWLSMSDEECIERVS